MRWGSGCRSWSGGDTPRGRRENAKQVKEQVKAATAERQVKAEQKRQEEVELALEQRLEREVAERSGHVEEARRLQLRKAREAQIKERAQAGWGSMDLSHGNMTAVPTGAARWPAASPRSL